jgi:hypothetical protein
MHTKLNRAIVTAAAAVTIGTMSVLPAAADWRDNHGGYRATHPDHGFARRDRYEGRYPHWFFRYHSFDFDRR